MARILVVDDDADVIRIVERVLKMGGHDVYSAHDAMKAMDLLNASMFDLLISDANMPRFSGFDLVRTLKNNKRFSRMAVAMLTGLREKKDIEKGIRAGVDDYIIKPIDPAILVAKIESLLEKKPPMEQATYSPPEMASFATAQITYQARITEVSEIGVTVRSGIEIPEGLAIQIASDIFKRIDTKAPPMKVISCRKLVEFDHEIKVAFVGINDAFQKKIRAWIHTQTSMKKGVA